MKHAELTLKTLPIAVMFACNFVPNSYAEDESTPTAKTSPIVVTGTRTEQNSFDLPIAIDVVSEKDIQDGQLGMTLSESLIRTPGITAQNRNNQAQDPQISSRGFGSRSSFGVRGVRVYVDGIPLTMPDGQGQPGVVDLTAIKSIEVMRGPFSALYGNSSGGVIQMLTEDAPKTPEVGGTVMFGSYNTKRQVIDTAGSLDGIDYLLNVSNFETDGYRAHNSADKQQATAQFKFNLTDSTKITTLINWFDQAAEDPGGLKRTASSGEPSAFTDPESVFAGAIRSDTRVYRKHTQVGFNLEQLIDQNNTINLIAYVGTRDNEQYLALNNTGSGRASIISREFWGSDIRWTNKGNLLDRPYTVSAGMTYGRMQDARKDINTTNGIQLAATTTNTNRDEENISNNFDQYVQAQWSALDNIDLHAGIRHTEVNLKVEDHLVGTVTASSTTFKFRDGSGSVEHKKTTPVVGVVFKATPSTNLYANYGKGFETPTFIEVAYDNPTTGSGPNLGIKPSTSNNYEVGMKTFLTDNARANVSLFKTNTNKEIVAISGNPYAVYTNAGRTERKGIEASIDADFDHNISAYASYTFLDAKFKDAFFSTANVAAGNYIPGTYRTQLYGEISWKLPSAGFFSALEARYNSKVYVDDVNSDAAPSYTVFNARAGFEQKLSQWNFKEYLRVENLFDKQYIGSVRVNDTNSRFFEPGPTRNYLLGLSANYRF